MRPSHIIVLIVVLIVIFGAAKLPEIAKSIGQSAKVFKQEMKELADDVPPAELPEGEAEDGSDSAKA